MRSYVVATGVLFALILTAHGARLASEGLGPLRDPVFVVSSALSLAAVAWALTMWARGRRR